MQTWLVKKVAGNLSEKLHTRVTVKKVDFRFFNKILLEGLMIEDRKKDTLLYAGVAKANLNDWFFFRDKISLENVGLDDAIVNMKRTDSVWNYQFLLDYFASPKKKKTGGTDVVIDLRELHFNKIKFNKIDGWIGQDMIVNLSRMDVVMNVFDILHKKIFIKNVSLTQPFFSQRDYKGNRPDRPNLQQVIEKIPVIGAFKWNDSGWEIRLDKLDMHDGAFRNDKYTNELPYTDRFDGQHLFFTELNGTMKNLLFLHDTLSVNVLLSAAERSGLNIKKLESNMKFTPELMEFNNLDLITNRSRLRDYFAMKYENFGEDFSSFIHSVTMVADFKESTLSSDDLAIFAPALKSWRRTFYIEGNAKGPLDNFSAKDMKIRSGNSYVEGNIAMRGLPDINTTFIDFQSKQLRTNYAEMVSIIPQLRNIETPAISKLGAVSFKGNFTGFIRDFVAFGTFNTALGIVTADVNMKTPSGTPPAYSGNLLSPGFNIGAFLRNPDLGNIALNTKVSGTGFNTNELSVKVDGKVNAFSFRGYNYQNLLINGDFNRKLFVGHFSIDDPNLKITNMDGALDLTAKSPGFKLQALVQRANFKQLGFSSNNLSFSGNLDLNFTGKNIDNFLGDAQIYNAVLLKDSTKLSFDRLSVRSQLINGKKSLTLQSNEIDASIIGDFQIAEMPDAVKVLLAKYYPTYIQAPRYIVKSRQNFDFTVNTKNVDQYIKLLDPKLGGFNNANIAGSFNLQNYDLKLKATIPQFTYAGKTFTNTEIFGTGTRDTLIADIAVEDIILSDSRHLPNTKLRVAANNDLSLIKLNTSASQIFGDAELNATIQTLSDGIKIHFFPSSFVINNKKWQLDKDGELTLRKDFFDASEVKFFHDDQEIILSTANTDNKEDTHLLVQLKNLPIQDFAFLLPAKPALKGFITGAATVHDVLRKPIIEFAGRADSFELDGKYLGRVNLQTDANTATGEIAYKVNTDEKEYKFSATGSYNFKDSTGNSLRINLLADKMNIDILKPYLSTVFSDIRGIANGNILISNNNKDLSLTGDAIITGGNFKVAYTQVRYLFEKQLIRFGKGFIDLGTMLIKDTLGNEGTLSGKMYHKFFQEFSFENMRFSSPKMLLLNTTKKDNSQFYGNVIGRATMTLNGDIANMKMNIEGEPSETDSSHIYLPTGDTKESNVIDYIEFIQFGSLMDKEASGKDNSNLLVDMNFTANPSCKIDVILNEETGDIIKGEGNGQLKIRVGTKEPLSIRGRYDITKGDYTFNFQTFLKRPFTLSRGAIVWNGDPLQAVIDMEAEYLAKNVDISSISSLSSGRRQEDLRILSHIKGSLQKPVINFEFVLPEKSEYNKDYYVVKRLADYKNDENEMNKQVASLLLFNRFIDNNQAFINGNTTLSLATSTIGGVISAWLTSVLSKALQKATNGVVTPYLDLNTSLNTSLNSQQVNRLQANVRAGLKFRFSQNLQLLIGGNLDYNNPVAQLYSKGIITPDISLEWLLTKDGSLRVVAFNRTTIDFTTGQRNRSGLQLSYRKDVDRLGDIFRSRKKIEELDSLKFSPKIIP